MNPRAALTRPTPLAGAVSYTHLLTGLITQNEFSFCKEEKRRRSGLRQVFLMSQMEIQASYVVQLFAV